MFNNTFTLNIIFKTLRLVTFSSYGKTNEYIHNITKLLYNSRFREFQLCNFLRKFYIRKQYTSIILKKFVKRLTSIILLYRESRYYTLIQCAFHSPGKSAGKVQAYMAIFTQDPKNTGRILILILKPLNLTSPYESHQIECDVYFQIL